MDTDLRVGVVGAGRVGAVLAAALRARGHEIVAVAGESDASRQRAEALLPGVPVLKPTAVARAYDVRFSAPTGYSTDSEPTARDVANLIRQVREQKIKALFIENMTNPALVAEIARDSGASVGPRLYSDALSRPDGPAPTYEAMMRHNVTALVAGMQKN